MPPEQSLPRPSDKWIPYYFFAFFAALVLVLVPMCIIAVRTNSGIVTDHAYEQGLAYNKAILAKEQQDSLQWRGDLQISLSSNGQVQADFFLKDSAGRPLNDADIHFWFVRPTQSGMDQKAVMTSIADGHYSATISVPIHGLWEARISAMLKEQNYQLTKRVVLP